MKPSSGILVTGATGVTGSHLARLLLSGGFSARLAARSQVVMRNAPSLKFDWRDPATYDAVLDGVSRVFIAPPPNEKDADKAVLPFLRRAAEMDVRRVVLLSCSLISPGAPGVGIIHEQVMRMFPEWVILRPRSYMQNFVGDHPIAQIIRRDKAIVSCTEVGRTSFVDASDVARVALRALVDAIPQQDLLITGPQPFSMDEVASLISATTGVQVTHRNLKFVPTIYKLMEFYPERVATLLAQFDGAVARGSEARTTDTVFQITGQHPRHFGDFLKEEWNQIDIRKREVL